MTTKLHRHQMKKMHDRRREDGICIQNKTHGSAFRGGRCEACWQKKLKAEREHYAAKRTEAAEVSTQTGSSS